MGYQLLIAGVSTGLNIVSALDTADFRSRTLREFTELRNYLHQIGTKIDTLLDQNRQIMERLDNLPAQIYQITDEVVAAHLLTERYVAIRARQTLYTSVTDIDEWEPSREGWIDFNEDLHYIYLKEYRLSHMLRVIPASELAIAIYRSFAIPVVRILVSEKLRKLNELLSAMEDKIVRLLDGLSTLLSNEKFVAAHNLSRNLEDFANLTFSMRGHRTRTESYVERVCEPADIDCCRPRTVCRNVTRRRTVPDTSFNNTHDGHENEIRRMIGEITSQLGMFSDLRQIVESVSAYADGLSQEALTEGSDGYSIELVSLGTEEMLDKSREGLDRNIVIKRLRDCY